MTLHLTPKSKSVVVFVTLILASTLWTACGNQGTQPSAANQPSVSAQLSITAAPGGPVQLGTTAQPVLELTPPPVQTTSIAEPSPTPVPPTQAPPTPLPSNVYVVAPGDTLTGIAARFGTTIQALAAENSITNTDQIQAGQQLVVPERTNADPNQTSVTTP